MKEVEGVFEDGFLLLLVFVVVDEIGFEVVLDEVGGAFVFGMEYSEWNDLEDDLELEWGGFYVFEEFIQKIEGEVYCL